MSTLTHGDEEVSFPSLDPAQARDETSGPVNSQERPDTFKTFASPAETDNATHEMASHGNPAPNLAEEPKNLRLESQNKHNQASVVKIEPHDSIAKEEPQDIPIKMETLEHPEQPLTKENAAGLTNTRQHSIGCLGLDGTPAPGAGSTTGEHLAPESDLNHDSPYVPESSGSESDDDSDSSDLDFRDSESDAEGEVRQKPATPKGTKPKQRRRFVKNPRDYCARLLERLGSEDGKENRKKSRKKREHTKDAGNCSIGANLGAPVNGMAVSTAPAMPAISATTLDKQYAAYQAQLPAGHDTRRRLTQLTDLKEAQRMFGFKRIAAADGDFKLKTMNCTIKPHQLTAISWMLKRELMGLEPLGGIVADAMGMGKTIISLACISENRPELQDVKEFCQATLVLVPNQATATQWEEQVRKHCTSPVSLTVQIYRSDNRTSLDDLQKGSIVIATYTELLVHFPSKTEVQAIKQRYGDDETAIQKEIEKHMANLFHIKWYRVVLDEAHAIRNRNSITAMACTFIRAKHRWALSGTPLANTAEEFYPYLKFLHCPFTYDFKKFKNEYLKDSQGMARFEALVSTLMYRRTLKDTFLNHKILDIPEGNCETIWVPISEEEQVFVRAVKALYEASAESDEDEEMENGSEDDDETSNIIPAPESEEGEKATEKEAKKVRRYGNPKGTRLRQAVSHPLNLEKMIRQDLEAKHIQKMLQELKETGGKVDVIDQILQNVKDPGQLDSYKQGIETLKKLNRTWPVFGGRFDMTGILSLVQNEYIVRDETCGLCNKATPPIEPVKLDGCGHLYCSKCLTDVMRWIKDRKKKTTSKKATKKRLCRFGGCETELNLGDCLKTLNCIMGDIEREKGFQEPGRDANDITLTRNADANSFFCAAVHNKDEDDGDDDQDDEDDEDKDQDDGDVDMDEDGSVEPVKRSLPPSSKLTVAMAVILTWLKEHPQDKIIVFSQFVMTGKILGCMLQLAQKDFLYLYGSMTDGQRKHALREFEKNAKTKILLSSLKCGGQSLNLTHANRVIMIDPWWNTTAEEQAWGRVLRMGQQKKSHFVKIMTQETIDDQVSDLQGYKSREISYALQDDGHTPEPIEATQVNEIFRPCKKQKRCETAEKKRQKK